MRNFIAPKLKKSFWRQFWAWLSRMTQTPDPEKIFESSSVKQYLNASCLKWSSESWAVQTRIFNINEQRKQNDVPVRGGKLAHGKWFPFHWWATSFDTRKKKPKFLVGNRSIYLVGYILKSEKYFFHLLNILIWTRICCVTIHPILFSGVVSRNPPWDKSPTLCPKGLTFQSLTYTCACWDFVQKWVELNKLTKIFFNNAGRTLYLRFILWRLQDGCDLVRKRKYNKNICPWAFRSLPRNSHFLRNFALGKRYVNFSDQGIPQPHSQCPVPTPVVERGNPGN